MTMEQSAVLAANRNDCFAKNRRNRYAWEVRSVSLAVLEQQNEPDLIGTTMDSLTLLASSQELQT